MGKLISSIRQLFQYQEQNNYEFTLSDSNVHPNEEPDKIHEKVSYKYDDNLTFIQDKYSVRINSDIKLREFFLTFQNKQYKSFLFYIDGMIDTNSINHYVLDPLMLQSKTLSSHTQTNNQEKKVSIVKPQDFQNYVLDSLLPQNDVSTSNEFSQIFLAVNSGVSALFIDTLSVAFLIDAKGFEKRSIPIPDNEFIIRGSQEGFIEAIRTNTSLLRRLINSENLIIETTSVGKINNNTCCICYLKNIANPSLISEVKYRVNNVEVDSIISSGELEQLITDSKFGLPLVIATERPDRVASYLLDGRVAIIINGSPYVLVAPSVLTDFLSSSEDKNINSYFSNSLKFVRLLALIITLSLPGFYIAVTTFHQEIIPTELLFAIVSSRNSVPFPIIFEILIMEISLELIRESGIYVPSPLGQTIGIVGGLILGDAAVSAHIVSPILIIVVAITGLTSFAVPDYSLSFHIRIVRFAYILAGYFAGFLGIALAITIHLAALSSINSFGVCYLNPYTFFGVHKSNSYFLNPIWKRENREPFLKTKRAQREPKISMKWKFGGKN